MVTAFTTQAHTGEANCQAGRQWIQSITGGLSLQAIAEYLELIREAMELVQLSDHQPDKLVWRWTQDGCYTAQSTYRMLHAGSTKFSALSQSKLENLGSFTSQNLSLVGLATSPLDGR